MRETIHLGRTPFAYERITVTNAAVARLSANYRGTYKAVFLSVETNNLRYRIDGGNPDANNGHLVYATQNLFFEDPKSLRELRMLGIGGNAIVIATYYQ